MAAGDLVDGALVLVAVLAVATAEVGRRAATGRLRYGSVLGVRRPAPLASVQGWRQCHKAAAPTLLCASVAVILTCLLGLAGVVPAGLALPLAVVALVLGVVAAGNRANASARRRTETMPAPSLRVVARR